MTDADWLDEEEAPKKKSGMKKWLLAGCGCGCLLLVLGIAGVAFLLYRAVDPERQWPKIEELLAFDERPDLRLEMGLPFSMESYAQFVLTDVETGLQGQIQSFGANALATALDPLFEENPDMIPFGIGEPVDAELGEVEIQGRTVRALRYSTLGGLTAVLGPGIRVDLSRKGRTLSVQLTQLAKDGELTDEAIEAFFSHFDVWREE